MSSFWGAGIGLGGTLTMGYFYMCLAVNSDEFDDFCIHSMYFFNNIYEARINAYKNTSFNNISSVFVDIFKSHLI